MVLIPDNELDQIWRDVNDIITDESINTIINHNKFVTLMEKRGARFVKSNY